jgi:hypothetical protein
VDGVRAASQDVDTTSGPDAFAITVNVPTGTHELRIDWEDRGRVVATTTVTVTHTPPQGAATITGSATTAGASQSRTPAVKL